MDVKSAIIAAIHGPWPVLTPAQMDTLVNHFFLAFLPGGGVDGKRLVKALALNESSGGKHCMPRHEMGYCTGAESKNPLVVKLTAQFGHLAHCSFGPWQIMACNLPAGMSPEQMRDAEECARATSTFLIKQNIAHRPQSVAEWGQLWNGGHVGADNPGVRAYVAQLEHNYAAV